MKKINKVLLIGSVLFLLVGCSNMMDTPTKKVEEFLSKYQKQDNEVLDQLDSIIEEAENMNNEQREKYRDLMKKQYQNLSYKIKDETQDGTNANVEVEIEVYDYGKVINDANNYLTTNKEEFINEDGTIDTTKFIDYKIKQLENANDKIKYTINFTLSKVDDNWQLDDITDIDRQKLHGLYY